MRFRNGLIEVNFREIKKPIETLSALKVAGAGLEPTTFGL